MVAKYEVSVTGLVEELKRLGRWNDSARRALSAAMFREMRAVEKEAKETVPKDQGFLANSGFTAPPFMAGSIIIVKTEFGGTTAKYAEFVHDGGRKHWPPPGPLGEWAQRKGMGPGLDFVLRRAIAEHGTPIQTDPPMFLVDAFKKREPGMVGRLEADMVRRLKAEGL